MISALKRLFGAWPRWALITGGVVLAIILVLGFVYYFWVGVALVIFAMLGVGAYWAWVELPNRYEEGPDKAERAEQERRRREMTGE